MSGAVVDTREFREALEWVAKVVPSRPSQPVLGGIRMTFTDTTPAGPGVTLTAFDYEYSHTAHVAGMVTGVGEVLVPGLLARDMTGTMKGDTLGLEAPEDAAGLVMRAGRANVTLPELPLDDFPSLPKDPPTVGRIQAAALVGLSKTTWWACGRDDMLPVLTGVHLVADHVQVRAETTNRFTISRRELAWDAKPDAGVVDMIVPGRALGVAVAGLKGWVDVGCDTRLLRLSTDTRTVTLRLIDAEFPRLNNLWPSEDRAHAAVEISSEALLAALTRARIALEPNQSCLLRVTVDGVEVDSSGKGAIAGAAAIDTVEAVVTGLKPDDVVEQGFNPSFLAEAVNSLGADTARIWFTTGNKPASVRGDSDAIAALVMPRRAI